MKRVRRRNGHGVLFVSGSASQIGGNLAVVRNRLVERGLDRDYDIRATFRKSSGKKLTLREGLSIRWALAGADVIFVEGTRQRIVYEVDLDPDVRLVQLWHASGAFKAVGHSRAGRKRSSNPWSRLHRTYTHAIVSSEHDVLFYAEAFGIPEDRVVVTGIPRMDRFFDERRRAVGRAAALAAYPEAEGRMTILFAPTYRRGADWSYLFPLDRIDYAALHALCVEKDAVALIRMHPFARTDLKIPEAYRDHILDGLRSTIDVNDLLLAVDLLITDYSSILFDFSTLNRPMLFYAFDLDEYADLRDLYVPFETLVPGRIVRTFPELVDAIRRDDYEIEKVAGFAERHFRYLDAGSTDRVIDQLILRR